MSRIRKVIVVEAKNYSECSLKVNEIISRIRRNVINLTGIYDGHIFTCEPCDGYNWIWKVKIDIYFNFYE